MGLFDKLKKKEKKQFWTIRLNNDDYDIEHPDDFFINFDGALTDLEMGDLPFIVLSPPSPVNGITFLQVAQNENSLMHVEAGMIGHEKGKSVKVLYKDDLSTGEVLDIFLLFFREGELNTSDWELE